MEDFKELFYRKEKENLSFNEAVKKGIIDEVSEEYTDKAYNEAYKEWVEKNMDLKNFLEEYYNEQITDYDSAEVLCKKFRKTFDKESNKNAFIKHIKDEYGIEFHSSGVFPTPMDYLPNVSENLETKLITHEINYGKLTDEQVDKLELEIDNFVQDIEKNGGELYYQIKKNDKGETIVKFEGDADYWNYPELKDMVKSSIIESEKSEKIRTLKPNEADENKIYFDLNTQTYVESKYTPNDGGYWYWAGLWKPQREEEEIPDAEEIFAEPDDNDPEYKTKS